MESFHWDKNFETGLESVDQQHRHLVDIVNRFGSLLTENTIKFEDVEHIFEQLADYAQYHFSDEETLMAKVGVDKRHIEHHINAHQSFLKEASTIYASISHDDIESATHLLDFLTHWLVYHILGEDQKMTRQIGAIRAGTPADKAFERITTEIVNDKATDALLNALQGLFNQVSARNHELMELNQTLEQKVAQRTQALSALNHHLEEISLTDALTSLPNRRHAMRQLSGLLQSCKKDGLPLSCLMIDADHFKEVNDTYGHDAGDVVLITLAKTLQHSVRSDDIACRLGGDEFLIICPNTDHAGAMNIANIVHQKVSELRVATGGAPWVGSISIGVASYKPAMQNHEALIKQADKGVYMAKQQGKNCVRSVDGVM